MEFEPIEVAVALSLYAYNKSPFERAQKLYDHFNGGCPELDELMASLKNPFAATELPFPTASVYVDHALAQYGEEAKNRVMANK